MTKIAEFDRACKALAAAILLAASGAVAAEWTGSGELGLVFARGNSDTETVNAGFELRYEQDRWTNTLKSSYLRSENEGELDASRFVISNNTLYDLTERSYLVGSARYDQDKFSSFEYQATAGLGYGYRVLDGESHTLSVEAGPGVRFSEERDSGESETKLIARGALDYAWQISETARLENALLVESGASNTFVENALSLEVAINSAMSLKTGVAVRHNTDVAAGRDNTDVLSTVNLVYSFD
ncbi:DUF481 domain-containing protein [Halomonas denitrificans]|nr:DUF481 domain-containing protein [Halomonas denitrificans]